MNTTELAATLSLIENAREVAGIVLHHLGAEAARADPIADLDPAHGVDLLIASAWEMAKATHADEATARRLFVTLLRRQADGVEAL